MGYMLTKNVFEASKEISEPMLKRDDEPSYPKRCAGERMWGDRKGWNQLSQSELRLREKFEAEWNYRHPSVRSLSIKNLDDTIGDDFLKHLFKEFGTITHCRVLKDPQGCSLGKGLVSFFAAEEARNAVLEMNGKMLGGTILYAALCDGNEETRTRGLGPLFPQMNAPMDSNSDSKLNQIIIEDFLESVKEADDVSPESEEEYHDDDSQISTDIDSDRNNGTQIAVPRGDFYSPRSDSFKSCSPDDLAHHKHGNKSLIQGVQPTIIPLGTSSMSTKANPREVDHKKALCRRLYSDYQIRGRSTDTAREVNSGSLNPGKNVNPGAPQMLSMPTYEVTALLYVGGSGQTLSEAQLYHRFREVGQIASICTFQDLISGQSIGFTHLTYTRTIDSSPGKEVENLIPNIQFNSYLIMVSAKSELPTNVLFKNVDKLMSVQKLYHVLNTLGSIISWSVGSQSYSGACQFKGSGCVKFKHEGVGQFALEQVNDLLLKDKIERLHGMTLYVSDFDETVDYGKLRDLFLQFGTITSCKFVRENSPRNSRGQKFSKRFGFVVFNVPEEAERAIGEMNGRMVGGKPLYVALSKRRVAGPRERLFGMLL